MYRFALLLCAGLLLLLACSTAGAVNYNPNTTVIVYIHGFDMSGWNSTGVYGDDVWDDDLNLFASILGQPTWQTNPTAPNQIAATTYYGQIPPAWYTSQDIADVNAQPLYVPRYAMRCAKYIKHVIDRSPGCTGALVLGGSFGAEISRYMIEKNFCNLASEQKICKWATAVGVVTGNWAASNVPSWLASLFGADSPDIQQMTYDWVNANISARTTMNSAYFGPMVIGSWIATNDADDYITALCNKPNDGTNLCEDCFFWGYSTASALHQATDGTLQMPGKSFGHTVHTGIIDNQGAWAGLASFVKNNKRVTMTVTRLQCLTTGDSWIQGKGEMVVNASVTSPMANTLWGITAPMQYLITEGGMAPGVYAFSKNETKYPNCVIFDQIVPPGETSLTLSMWVDELDWHTEFYNVWENPFGSDKNLGTVTVSAPVGSTNSIYLSCGNWNADVQVAVRNVY